MREREHERERESERQREREREGVEVFLFQGLGFGSSFRVLGGWGGGWGVGWGGWVANRASYQDGGFRVLRLQAALNPQAMLNPHRQSTRNP